MKFRDLAIGQSFDFIGPDRMLNSFYSTCRKISARIYEWQLDDGRWKQGCVGSLDANVYHVDE
jgi:hypothetical protein